VPAGDHDQGPTDHSGFFLATAPQTGNYTATVRFHSALPTFDQFAGLATGDYTATWVSLESSKSPSAAGENDSVFASTAPASTFASDPAPARITRVSTLQRKAVAGGMSTYGFSTLQSSFPDGTFAIPDAQPVMVYAGNHGPAHDVRFEWLMVCPQ
jgi:hypothetical protein